MLMLMIYLECTELVYPKETKMSNSELLQQAVELARQEVKILKDPQSRLYPVLVERMRNLNVLGLREAASSEMDNSFFIAASREAKLMNAEREREVEQNSSSLIISSSLPTTTAAKQATPSRTTPRKVGMRKTPTLPQNDGDGEDDQENFFINQQEKQRQTSSFTSPTPKAKAMAMALAKAKDFTPTRPTTTTPGKFSSKNGGNNRISDESNELIMNPNPNPNNNFNGDSTSFILPTSNGTMATATTPPTTRTSSKTTTTSSKTPTHKQPLVMAGERKSTTPKPLGTKDLTVKFYPPRSISPRKPTTSASVASSGDFIIPKLEIISETRTGLVKKERASELEKMRGESDERLMVAIKHSIARQKAMAEEKQLKQKRINGRYAHIPSRFGLAAAAASTNAKHKLAEEIITARKATPTKPKIISPKKLPTQTRTTPLPNTTPLRPAISSPRLSKVSGKENGLSASRSSSSPQLTGTGNGPSNRNKLPTQPRTTLSSSNAALSRPVPSPRVSKVSEKEIGIVPSIPPPEEEEIMDMKEPTMLYADDGEIEIIELLNCLPPPPPPEAARVDMNPPVQQEQMNIKKVFNNYVQEAAITIENTRHYQIEKSTEVLTYALPTAPPAPPVLLNAAQPEINPPVQEEESNIRKNVYNHFIQEDAITIENTKPFYDYQSEKPAATPLLVEEVLILPEYLIDEFISDRDRRKRWNRAYFGSEFEPSKVLESIGQDVLLEMIDNICKEIYSISTDLVEELVGEEM